MYYESNIHFCFMDWDVFALQSFMDYNVVLKGGFSPKLKMNILHYISFTNDTLKFIFLNVSSDKCFIRRAHELTFQCQPVSHENAYTSNII